MTNKNKQSTTNSKFTKYTESNLLSNNCKLCLQRIFITSGGCAECKEGCKNYLKPLTYVEDEKGKVENKAFDMPLLKIQIPSPKIITAEEIFQIGSFYVDLF